MEQWHGHLHGLLLLKVLALRQRVAKTKADYEALLANKVSDDAPLPEQHDWWRAHDAAKEVYALTDWKYESMILRPIIVAALVLAVLSVVFSELIIAAVFVTIAGLWRCYVILTRHAPGGD
jgi:hypothetical protein